MGNRQLTILLTSCDAYSDAWEPFFCLWRKYWPSCDYPFILNSETKTFHSEHFQVNSFCGGKDLAWSKRLKLCLKTVNTEYVLLCLEDYFLQAPVNTEVFDAALKAMNENEKIGVVQFAIDIPTKYDGNIEINHYFSPVPKYQKDRNNGRIFCVLSLYRTKYLKKLLQAKESPWEFEIFGSLRSQYYREIILRENDNHPRCFSYYIEPKYGYAISRGKWLPKNRELFEENGIEVDFTNLGIVEATEYEKLLRDYYGKGQKATKYHHTFIQKLFLPFTDPSLFFAICRNLTKKSSFIVKLRFPFLPL
ncbi:MAG: hypothetical protein K6G71_08085 [Clostridiales bacterium]|nr:hypothetical protein [Clostridiales bacterium]